MTGKTHAGLGVVAYLVFCSKAPDKLSFIGFVVAVFSSLLPDIDHPKSIINKYILPFKNKVTKTFVYGCLGTAVLWYDYFYANLPILKGIGLLLLIISISSHRNGLTHSLCGMMLFTTVAAYIGIKYKVNLSYSFMLGYGSHLLCDMTTNRGVPLFYPIRNKKIKMPVTFKVGSKMGILIEDSIIIVGLLYIIYMIPSLVKGF